MLDLTFYLSTLDDDAERDKLSLIYERYYDSMRYAARRYVGQYGADEDAVHEAILKIIDHLDKIDLGDDLGARCFVCTVAANKAKDWLKKEKKFQISDIDNAVLYDEDVDSLPMEALLSKEGYQQLIDCIGSLGEIYRDVCMLKYVSHLKEREIAEVLEISPKTVSVRIVRAHRMLRAKIMEKIPEGVK